MVVCSLNILICDDDSAYISEIQNQIESFLAERGFPCSITVSQNPTMIAEGTDVYDLAFLDIQMPQMDGITLAKILRARCSRMALFFITNYDEYQDNAMDLQAFRFFEKPLNPERLKSGLSKALEYIDGAYVDVFLSTGSIQQRILADDILYVTRQNRKTAVVSGKETVIVSDGYDDLCGRLPAGFFFPVHKSFFVNLHYVNKYSYSEIFLTDGTRIPVAPRKQTEFHKFWFAYLRRR